MKKQILFLYTLILLFSATATAQNVGYMGKHVALHADYYGFFSFLKYNPRTDARTFGWNSRLAVGLEGAVSRRVSLVADYNYFSRTFVYRSGSILSPNPYGKGIVRGHGVELAVKLHYGDHIAPLGPYQRLGVAIHMINGSFRSLNKKTIYRNTGTIILPVFTYGVGFQRIFKDRLVFNAGMQIGIPFSLGTFVGEVMDATFSDSHTEYTPGSGQPSQNNRDHVKAQAAKHLFYNVNVGLGVLLF